MQGIASKFVCLCLMYPAGWWCVFLWSRMPFIRLSTPGTSTGLTAADRARLKPAVVEDTIRSTCLLARSYGLGTCPLSHPTDGL